jgi:uncharacterized protein YdhG (YjbR/CyaY superfamily)
MKQVTGKRRAPGTVEAYIAETPEPARTTLETLRETIRTTAPAAEEVISYQIPCYKLNGYLVGFAAFKNHCSFFPMSYSVIKTFKTELERYDLSKGTIRFSTSKPLPKTLVRKMVKARIAENTEKQKRKSG